MCEHLIEIWNLTGCNGQEQIGFNFPQSQFLTEFLLNLEVEVNTLHYRESVLNVLEYLIQNGW